MPRKLKVDMTPAELVAAAPAFEVAGDDPYPYLDELETLFHRYVAIPSYFAYIQGMADKQAENLVNMGIATEQEKQNFLLTQGRIQGIRSVYGTLLRMFEERASEHDTPEEEE